MEDYTQRVEDRMRLRHGAQIRFLLESGRQVLEDRLVPCMDIGGAITVASITYNGLTMSGGTSWRHPITGAALDTPHHSLWVRPQDVLADGEECNCSRCLVVV